MVREILICLLYSLLLSYLRIKSYKHTHTYINKRVFVCLSEISPERLVKCKTVAKYFEYFNHLLKQKQSAMTCKYVMLPGQHKV